MELACALVLLIVGSVTAGPYGYGTKGGAAAKADARAVAGAYAGPGVLPLSIPSGASYSGGFSQSASSSSSSSSASSSSFSFSGSGAIGGVVPGGAGCGSGSCNTGGATGAQGAAAAGAQAYSGAIGGSLAGGYGGKIPTGSYSHKYGNGESHGNKGQDCGSDGCSNLNGNGAGYGSQAASDAKAAATAGTGNSVGLDCVDSDCINAPDSDKCVSGKCVSKTKCSSGDCGAASPVSNNPSQSAGSNKCTSGECGLNQDTKGSSSFDNESNDINVHASGNTNSKQSYDANKPGCANGNCDSSSPSGTFAPSYNKPALDLTVPKLEPACSGSNCYSSPSGYSASSQTKAPFLSTSYQSDQLGYVSSPSYAGQSKPNYDHGSPIKPQGGASCVPGTPGCGITAPFTGPSDCTSGNCDSSPSAPGYDRPTIGKPGYSHGSAPVNPLKPACSPGTPGCITTPSTGFNTYGNSPSYSAGNPAGPTCAPGTPGCNITPSGSKPSDCASGNCVASPSGYGSSPGYKPNYSQGSSPSYSSVNPSSPGCAPGSPGCATSTLPNGPSGCASGNCGGFPTSPGYGVAPSNKPSYSHGGSFPASPLNPPGAGCLPGTPGCVTPSTTSGTYPSASGYGSSFNINPSYSHGSSPSHTPGNTLGQPCAPGTPGCGTTPSASRPSDCLSGNCGANPSAPGYTPSYPLGQPCAPGAPGCGATPSASRPSDCLSGNCGANPSAPGYSGAKPNYSNGVSPSYFSPNPSGPACSPGSPGCTLPATSTGVSGCAGGNCGPYPSSTGSSFGIKPSSSYGGLPPALGQRPSGSACAPGTPGCAPLPSAPSGPAACTSGNCDDFVPLGGQVSSNIKPTYSQGSLPSFLPLKPAGTSCSPGTPGCTTTPALSPSGCQSGNCGAHPVPQGCSPGSPGCSDLPSSSHSGSSVHPTASASVPVSGVPAWMNIGISAPGYGSSGFGSSLNQAAFGAQGTGSYNKPSSGFPTGTSGSGAYTPGLFSVPTASGVAGSGSPPHSGAGGATAGATSQHDEKDKPAYTGGFGGPAGLLKPNEYKAPTTSYGNKPTVSTIPTTGKPSCGSGICDAQGSPSHTHSGSAPGAQAIAGASASADAVAYTGGFGGPPGLLKPYDGGKVDLKSITGKQLTAATGDLHQGAGGSGILSTYSNEGSQVAASAVAQAASSAGASTGADNLHGGNNGGYSHGNNGAGGCGGGCGGSDSSNGLSTAGAAAKSVASASSGARAFGNSYASSSASAHAGASVKGGYGRR